MKIKVGMKTPVYPHWVEKAIEKLSLNDRDQIVKCVIYASMEPVTDGFKLHEVLHKMANRIPILPSIDNALAALMIAIPIMAWHVSKTSDEKISYEENRE